VVCTADDSTAVVTIVFESEREPGARPGSVHRAVEGSDDPGLCHVERRPKYFGYTGNTAVATFRGCDHPDHQP
jgi:hypothetical protein